MTPIGFPHSDIRGSKHASCSPRRFAGCCVLPRLSVPRHPPCALYNLPFCCLSNSSSTLVSILLTRSHFVIYSSSSSSFIHVPVYLGNVNCSFSEFNLFCFQRTLESDAALFTEVNTLSSSPWTHTGSNRRPPECKSGALPAELWAHQLFSTWAGVDLNHRPHAYQACALTS